MIHILVPNHTIWFLRWPLIAVKTARGDKAGTHQSSTVMLPGISTFQAWELQKMYPANKKMQNMQKENVFN